MAFWNHKKEEPQETQNVFDSDLLRELEASIRRSTESRDRATEKQLKATQDLTRALDNARKEFQRGFIRK